MKKIVIGLSIGLFALVGNAQYINGGKLIDEHDSSDYGKMLAIGYVLGVVDSYDGSAFCIPNELKSGYLRELVIDAIKENPHTHKRNAAELIFKGLSAAYPCQGKKQGQRLL